MSLKEELLKEEVWTNNFNKLLNHHKFSKEDESKLFAIKEYKREELVEKFCNGDLDFGTPRKLQIAKSGTQKKRVVYLYDLDIRLFFGVLYEVLSIYFSDAINERCFSYKKNTSTITAVKYIKENRTEEYNYCVKVDIHAYFNSVCKDRVNEMLNELFSDEVGIKTSLEHLYFNDCVLDNNKKIHEWKGLIPGTALASFFANYCLRDLDNYFSDKDIIYARYSDDILILAKSKEELDNSLNQVRYYLKKYDLVINPDKYTYFTPDDDITFLGLKLSRDGIVDISEHTKKKMKKTIHRWCKKARREIELGHSTFEKEAKNVLRRLNNKNFKCYINHEGTFGWCHYAFRYITTVDSLREIDYYTKDTLRYLKTGKHNKANFKKITEEEFHDLGFVSLVELYYLYKKDFDYYCERIELI